MHGAVFQCDVAGVADAETRSAVLFDLFQHPGRTVVKHAALVFGPAREGDVHGIQQHVVDEGRRGALDAHAVFGASGDVLEGDVVKRAQFGPRGAGKGGQRNGFAAAPPRIGIIARDELDVLELHVERRCLRRAVEWSGRGCW